MPIVRDDQAHNILTDTQRSLSPLLEEFAKTHILVWGTAIALQIWHRTSIDYDLFCFGHQGSGISLMERIQQTGCMFDLDTSPRFWYSPDEIPELTLFFQWVKVQFIDFSRNPFDIPISITSDRLLYDTIPSLSLLQLWALKVYAMMYRKKIKDIIDLYFILHHTDVQLIDIIIQAQEIFGRLYKPEHTYEAIFDPERDHTETVEYMIKNPPSLDEVFAYIRSQVDNLL